MQIAAITNGRYYYAPEASILISIYQEISEMVENITTEELWDTDTMQITIKNVKPEIKPFGPFTLNKGSSFNITGKASDLGSDDLTFTWSFEYGPTMTNIFYNDGVGPDPHPSPGGIFPFSVNDTVGHTYGDVGNYSIILTVTDDDGGIAVYETYVLVNNGPPSIISMDYSIVFINEPRTVGYWGHQCEVEEPYGDHTGILQKWVDEIAAQSRVFSGISTKDDVEDVVQFGNAEDMIVMAKRQLMGVWLNVVSGKLYPQSEIQMPSLTASKTLMEAILEIEDVILTSSDRSELERVKDIADNINNGRGIALANLEFEATALGPGADALTFHWDFGDGKSQDHFFPNVNGTFPFEVMDNIWHSYFTLGTFNVTLTVTDDDGETTTEILGIMIS
jgi:PKD repeat protein